MFDLRKIIAILITLIILLIAGFIFALNIISVSHRVEFTEEKTANIKDSVKVFRNNYGIPHIISNNERDAYFALGYCQAQDRLWLLDYLRRASLGQLSEIFGESFVNSDKFMRLLNIKNISHQSYNNLSNNVKECLKSYANGVNEFIRSHKTKLPIEFNSLQYIPNEWLPEHSIAIQRFIALSNSQGFYVDAIYGSIADKIGVDNALKLIPSYPLDVPYVLDNNYTDKKINLQITDTTIKKLDIFKWDKIISGFSDDYSYFRKIMNFSGTSIGSNVWATRKVEDGKYQAILSSDPHFPVFLPSIWYQVHISFPNKNIVGVCITGIPFLFTGHNDVISWSSADMHLDDCDLFIEKIDSTDKNFYITPAGRKKFNLVKDTIKIKNKEDYVFYIRKTERSSVISDFSNYNNYLPFPRIKNYSFSKEYKEKYFMTYAWTGNNFSTELETLYQIQNTHNWQQFLKYTKSWGCPSVNFVYSDKNGNIGLVPTGLMPSRNINTKPNLPNPGWIDGYSWINSNKRIAFTEQYNPSKNYVGAANNPLTRESGTYLSNYWQPSSRAERIEQLLRNFSEYSYRDAQMMQVDYLSPYSKDLLNYCLPILNKKINNFNSIQKGSYQKLKNWDFILSSKSIAASIYHSFFQRLSYNILADELGEKLFKDYYSLSNISSRKILEILYDSSSFFIDNINTNQIENKENIILQSFTGAVDSLINFFGNENIEEWYYGEIHQLNIRHIFAKTGFLNDGFISGPHKIGGNNTTINITESAYGLNTEVNVFSSLRFVTDMSDNFVYFCLPGGASGQSLGINFSDQMLLWLNGGFVKISTSSIPTQDNKLTIIFTSQ